MMKSSLSRWVSLALSAGAALLGGCASPWERSFVAAAPLPEVDRAEPATVTIREVPWARISEALTEMDKEIAASDVHPDEWPADKQRATEEKLLRALQLTESPDDVVILGRSDFSTTDRIDPRDGSLAKFAAEIGADYAIWSRAYRGKTDRVVTEPVSTFRTETIHFRDRRGRHRTDTISGWYTTYVPVVVEADEWAWVAFFVKRD